jgi:hypothetical protein
MKDLMDAFRVSTYRMDGATCVRVDGLENTHWLLTRLSDFFVFKSCEPVRNVSDSSAYTFRVAHYSRLSGKQFEKLLAGISEVNLILESPQAAW